MRLLPDGAAVRPGVRRVVAGGDGLRDADRLPSLPGVPQQNFPAAKVLSSCAFSDRPYSLFSFLYIFLFFHPSNILGCFFFPHSELTNLIFIVEAV